MMLFSGSMIVCYMVHIQSQPYSNNKIHQLADQFQPTTGAVVRAESFAEGPRLAGKTCMATTVVTYQSTPQMPHI